MKQCSQETCVSEFPPLPHIFANTTSFLFILDVKGGKNKHRKLVFVSDSSFPHVTPRVVAFCPSWPSTVSLPAHRDVLWYLF